MKASEATPACPIGKDPDARAVVSGLVRPMEPSKLKTTSALRIRSR